MKTHLKTVLILSIICSCKPNVQEIYLGQGMMAGEATSTTIFLQSRLTVSDTLTNGNLFGRSGVGIFQIDVNSSFDNPFHSDRVEALPENDFIIRTKIEGLKPGTKYFYRLQFGTDTNSFYISETASFKTLPGPDSDAEISFAIVTGMNYDKFHFGAYERSTAYSGPDKLLGYPALSAIQNLHPDYFIGTGDNVYFDFPQSKNFH